jgi:hypothetical protein
MAKGQAVRKRPSRVVRKGSAGANNLKKRKGRQARGGFYGNVCIGTHRLARKTAVAESHLDKRLPSILQTMIRNEGRHWWILLAEWYKNSVFGEGTRWKCPMCVTKTANRKQDLQKHMIKFHMNQKNGTPSKKQQSMIQAMYTHDQLRQTARSILGAGPTGESHYYLHRSAVAIKQQLERSPAWPHQRLFLEKQTTQIDKYLRLLLESEGARYILADDAASFHR